MSVADIKFVEMCKNIIENGHSSEGQIVRPKWNDGTYAHTMKSFCVVNRYDLSKEFPILTMRYINWKAAIDEILWIFQRQSNNIKDLKSKIWDQWADKNGSIGKSYGFQIESRPNKDVVIVKKRIKEKQILKPNEKYPPTILVFASLGNYESVPNFTREQVDILKEKWRSMIARCYSGTGEVYKKYGAKGIFVDKNWHIFENFLRDVKYIPQWFLAKDNLSEWDLDKDYYESNCYSLDTCVFLSKEDNYLYRDQSSPFYLILPNGEKKIYISRKRCVEENDISRASLLNLSSGKRSSVKGFKFEKIKQEKDECYRYKLSKNQVNDVLFLLKNDPYSRRIMTNFWNFSDIEEKNLMECAYSLTFNVTDNKLNAILNQRSQDVLVANSWNVCQYAALVHMFAQVSGLKVGEFVHVIADAHIYDKHIPIVKELIERKQHPAPKLLINPTVKNFYDFKVEDFYLYDYKTEPQIKNIPVAE